MEINKQKTIAIIIRPPTTILRNSLKNTIDLKITISGSEVKLLREIRYLGIFFTHLFKFNHQINYILKKVACLTQLKFFFINNLSDQY